MKSNDNYITDEAKRMKIYLNARRGRARGARQMVYYKDKWGGILGLRDIKRKEKEGREQERRENLY